MNIKKILLPVDFSECSKTATSFSFELALRLNARIYLMHSMKNILSVPLENFLEEFINDDRFQQVDVKTITEIGDPDLSILREAEILKANLIVMGSKGSSGGRKLLGSTTSRIISKSDIPVLAVPQDSTYSNFEDIVFMTDFNEGDVSALKEISDWARLFNANLHVLHLFTDDSLQELIKFRGFKEIVKERLEYNKLSFERVFNSSFKEGFFKYLKTHSPKLLVLTRYKKTLFQKAIERDHGRQIGYKTTVPFLTIPAEKYVEERQRHSILKE